MIFLNKTNSLQKCNEPGESCKTGNFEATDIKASTFIEVWISDKIKATWGGGLGNDIGVTRDDLDHAHKPCAWRSRKRAMRSAVKGGWRAGRSHSVRSKPYFPWKLRLWFSTSFSRKPSFLCYGARVSWSRQDNCAIIHWNDRQDTKAIDWIIYTHPHGSRWCIRVERRNYKTVVLGRN